MRHLPFLLVSACLVVASGGCALIRGLDEYTTADPPSASDPITGQDGGAPPSPPAEGGITPEGGCKSNRQCSALATSAGIVSGTPTVPTVCVKATGTCEPLLSEDCPRLVGDPLNDDAVVLGTLLSDTAPSTLERAAFLAAEEIDQSSGAQRPLVVVGCNVAADVMRATKHLAQALRVPAIVGPTSGEQVIDVTQQISAKAGTLLMTPTSFASAITNLADDDLTWRSTPSDTQRAKLVIQQITDLESVLRTTRGLTTVKLGIVHPTDALGTSARDAISGTLILNGRFIGDAANAANVSLDAYDAGNVSAQAAIATKYAVTFKPDIVFITSVEQVAGLIVPLEQALTAARAVARPYYVMTDASRTQALLDAVAGTSLPLDMKRRIRGVGVKPDTGSAGVLQDFRAAFTARYGGAPPEDAAPIAYDATYAIAYSLAASTATQPSGASVAHGLRTLAVGNPATVGAKSLGAVLHDLSNGKSVSLRGTYGLLQWDASGDIAGGTLEVWCLGAVAGAPAFGSSGVTMDVQTQVVGGAFVQCQ